MKFHFHFTKSSGSEIRNGIVSLFCFLLFVWPRPGLQAQTQAQIDSIRAASDTANLTVLELKYDSMWTTDHSAAISVAGLKGFTVATNATDSVRWELQWISADSIPVYSQIDNIISAQSISTNEVHTGGGAGLSLDGSGFRVGQWDGGAAMLSHPEYSGRVATGDLTITNNFHATHVAGTILGSGANASAKGMAPAATMTFYSFNNDATEMTAEANSGLILSNHSYGFITGWTKGDFGAGQGDYWFGSPGISATEDFRFGFYSASTKTWDVISNNAPFYLIVKSAGNDRAEGPAPGSSHFVVPAGGSDWVTSTDTRDLDGGTGGFDCIEEKAVAKNILTVGAVNDIAGGYTQPSDVVATSFTSFGPTDDGRIKPDIVANGSCLLSAWDGTAMFGCTGNCSGQNYCSISGTSMSAPSVTGSALLLQQHYAATHFGELMFSSTLKALIIHTADEAGPANGPDYKFGWGMMNTEAAANMITADVGTSVIIQEITISNGSSYSLNFTHDGTASPTMKATIAWNDPAGTPGPPALDPTTPMLVNDMDLLIIREDNANFLPWILDKANPTANAVNADNTVDNVEQIYLVAPLAMDYELKITHKGTLTGNSQMVSLILTGFDSFVGITKNGVGDKVDVEVYPHPLTSASVLEVNVPSKSEEFEVRILTAMGQEISRHPLKNGLNQIALPADEFESGIYFYEVEQSGNQVENGKFVVVNK